MTRAEQLVADNMGLAVSIAYAEIHRLRVPDLLHDDCRSAALIGLWRAAEHYSPDQGATFATYAGHRIKGAIGDELRRVWYGRATPRGNNWRDRRREFSLERFAEEEMRTHGFDPIPVSELACMADPDSDPAGLVDDAEAGYTARDLLAELNWDDRQIADWYFVEELPMAEIGRRLGVTESRVCQRLGAIKRRLRRMAVRTGLVEAAA